MVVTTAMWWLADNTTNNKPERATKAVVCGIVTTFILAILCASEMGI